MDINILSNAENIKIIDDVITNFVEWADEPTDDIRNAWVDIQKSLTIYHDNAIQLLANMACQADEDTPVDYRTRHFTECLEECIEFLKREKNDGN